MYHIYQEPKICTRFDSSSTVFFCFRKITNHQEFFDFLHLKCSQHLKILNTLKCSRDFVNQKVKTTGSEKLQKIVLKGY